MPNINISPSGYEKKREKEGIQYNSDKLKKEG